MTFLKEDTSVRSKEVLEITKKCLHFMPSSLRICDSIFNSMIVVGDFTGHGEIPLHFDTDDYINAIVSIGDKKVVGGGTVYFVGISAKHPGRKVKDVSFKHGRVQVGYFDDVVHGASPWTDGIRGVLNFCVKKKQLLHFLKYRDVYYSQFVKAGYPRGKFLAK